MHLLHQPNDDDPTALPLDEMDQGKAPAHYTRFANYLDLWRASAVPNTESRRTGLADVTTADRPAAPTTIA
jgi:hypothetical protein